MLCPFSSEKEQANIGFHFGKRTGEAERKNRKPPVFGCDKSMTLLPCMAWWHDSDSDGVSNAYSILSGGDD